MNTSFYASAATVPAPRGRPRKDPAQVRTARFPLALTAAERGAIAEEAAARGQTMAEWARRCLRREAGLDPAGCLPPALEIRVTDDNDPPLIAAVRVVSAAAHCVVLHVELSRKGCEADGSEGLTAWFRCPAEGLAASVTLMLPWAEGSYQLAAAASGRYGAYVIAHANAALLTTALYVCSM